MQYPARVELHVITEHRHKLVATGLHWQYPASFEACSFEKLHDDGHEYSIAWEHRHHLRQAFTSGTSWEICQCPSTVNQSALCVRLSSAAPYG